MTGRVLVFGEVLFDVFPDGAARLGGAPFNVAWHLQGFGLEPFFVSRVGEGERGANVRERMSDWGMDTRGLQADDRRPTGAVWVRMERGEPSYEIVPDVAFDAIDAEALEDIVRRNDWAMAYHGSLALREQGNRAAWARLAAACGAPVFVDVNLRDPWSPTARVQAMLAAARWAKVNEDELARLAGEGAAACEAALNFSLEALVVTRGEAGASVGRADGKVWEALAVGVDNLVDTVGAGDAFSAVVVLGLLRQWPWDTVLRRASGFAALVCGQAGAIIENRAVYEARLAVWNEEDQR
jgi:fructokinase